MLSIYAVTLCRTVAAGDSGELTAVACSGGVAHAPGYPLYTLLAAPAARLFAEPAAGVNALSALAGAAGCAVLFLTVHRLTGSRLAATYAAVGLGLSRAVWHYALVSEVFALNNLFAALLLDLAARVATHLGPSPPPRPLFGAIAAVSAAGVVTHHTTLVLVAAPVAGCAIIAALRRPRRGGWCWPQGERSRVAVLCGLMAIVGMAPLAYLPLAARRDPVLNWDDPRDFAGVKRAILREDYGTGQLVAASAVQAAVEQYGESARAGALAHLWRYAAELPRRFFWLTPALAVTGGALVARERRWPLRGPLTGFAVLLVAFYVRVNLPLTELHLGVAERFQILPDLVLMLLAGVGLAALATSLRRRLPARFVPWAVGLTALCAVVPAAVRNGRAVEQRGERFTSELGHNLLASLPDGALLLSAGDMMHNALHYQVLCLGRRTDLDHVDLQKLSYGWYVRSLPRALPRVVMPAADAADSRPSALAWVHANIGRRPVALFNPGTDRSHERGYLDVPWGLVRRVFPADAVPTLAEQLAAQEAILRRMDLAGAFAPHDPRSFEHDSAAVYPGFFARLAFLREMEGRRLRAAGDTRGEALQHDAEAALADARRVPHQPEALGAALATYAYDLAASAAAGRASAPAEAAFLYRRAENLYRQALTLDSASFVTLVNLAALYTQAPELGHGAEIFVLLERAVSLHPENLRHLDLLAAHAAASADRPLLRRVAGYIARAIATYERRLAASPARVDRAVIAAQIADLRAKLNRVQRASR